MRTDFEKQKKEKYIMFWKTVKGLFVIAFLANFSVLGYLVVQELQWQQTERHLAERRESYDKVVNAIADSESVEFHWYGGSSGNTDALGGFENRFITQQNPSVTVRVYGRVNGKYIGQVAVLEVDNIDDYGIVIERDFREALRRDAVITEVSSPELARILGISQEKLPFNLDIR